MWIPHSTIHNMNCWPAIHPFISACMCSFVGPSICRNAVLYPLLVGPSTQVHPFARNTRAWKVRFSSTRCTSIVSEMKDKRVEVNYNCWTKMSWNANSKRWVSGIRWKRPKIQRCMCTLKNLSLCLPMGTINFMVKMGEKRTMHFETIWSLHILGPYFRLPPCYPNRHVTRNKARLMTNPSTDFATQLSVNLSGSWFHDPWGTRACHFQGSCDCRGHWQRSWL